VARVIRAEARSRQPAGLGPALSALHYVANDGFMLRYRRAAVGAFGRQRKALSSAEVRIQVGQAGAKLGLGQQQFQTASAGLPWFCDDGGGCRVLRLLLVEDVSAGTRVLHE